MTSDPLAVEPLERWVNNALRAVEGDPEAQNFAQALRDLSIRVRKLRRASQRPAALGFFGPSQAGKSFLVGALLSHELGNLTVLTRSKELDFLKEINPAKGVESTGVVTRFSTRPPPDPLQRGDLYCRLVSLEVLIESLATGFLAECTSPEVDPERVGRCLRDARMAEGPAAPARYREAFETVWHNLFKKYRDRHPYLNDLRRQSALTGTDWKDAVKTRAGWSLVFTLLWGGPGYAQDLDVLSQKLIEGLEALDHAEGIEVGLEHVRASSDGVSLIDAACLNSIGSPRDGVTVYAGKDAHEVSIAPAVLSGLIAELYLPFKPVPGSLLEHGDILDFPGGRALKGINGFGHEDLNTKRLDNSIEVYKRGKLTFLFEQFSVEREITVLCLCSPGPTKPEAIQLQSQVEQWLKIRYGNKTPTNQEELEHPSLFMALTKYDMSLGALRSDNAKERWESRVQEACIDFWARNQGSWILNWGARGRAFDNCFWIRNPYADQMRTLAPGSDDYEAVKRGYFEARAVGRHIKNPEEKWRAVEGDNDDGMPKSGVPLLSAHLRDKLAEDVKGRELADETVAIAHELRTILKSLTPSTDENEERERILESAQLLTDAIRQEMAKRCSGAVFGELMRAIVPEPIEVEQEVRAIYAMVAPMSIKASDKVKKVLVHMLKWWMLTASNRYRESSLSISRSAVELFLREVCTSKKLLPVLGKAIYPYFSRTTIDPALIATILRVTVADALVVLFKAHERTTPEGPIRLSYAEQPFAEGGSPDSIDWTDVDFDDDEPEETAHDVEIVFAGRGTLERFSQALGEFYLENRGARPAAQQDDPRVKVLSVILRELSEAHVARPA